MFVVPSIYVPRLVAVVVDDFALVVVVVKADYLIEIFVTDVRINPWDKSGSSRQQI